MVVFDRLNIRTWSMLSSRGTFGSIMLELAHECENLVILSADLCNSSGLDRFRNKYSGKFINTGIAEQNMLGIAAGLTKEGYNVYCTTFSPFATMRACEQVRNHMGYMNLGIKLVGLASGFATGILGNSHYGLEDIAILRSIPNLTIISPADCTETAKAAIASVNYNGPIYLRLTGTMNNPVVYKQDYDFEIGKSITLKDGDDVTIISSGTMVYNSLKAAKFLEEKGISATVIDMHTIKPLDTEILHREASKSKLFVTVEEHNRIGGLGSSVAEHLSCLSKSPSLLILGIRDQFCKAGEYEYMLDQNGLMPGQIADSIMAKLNSI